MSMEYCAYSFLPQRHHRCDYEIATDQLAISFSILKHYVKHIAQKDIVRLIELLYHSNGSICGKSAKHEEEIHELTSMYDVYDIPMKHFVLANGCVGASYVQKAKAAAKAIIRMMHLVQKDGYEIPHTLNFMNVLSNTCFMMCLYENTPEHVEECIFESKSYAN